ncbi:hypothetical protein [Candidatus Neptunochlamydia vexilliferae]|uniref:Ras-GEF domain-containing protein n=1 Tax=Candidatus Neptunichlamydia vexilliferae TaxID=1651774 RepID=A0ABS0AWT9_9BACT|nr:hypothetical protein [Candidatus Neptunochlamydia vexilliferae]MBF5058602.1 hypothetical protein [Candidatus Neptunochlamydia vexilliferae]
MSASVQKKIVSSQDNPFIGSKQIPSVNEKLSDFTSRLSRDTLTTAFDLSQKKMKPKAGKVLLEAIKVNYTLLQLTFPKGLKEADSNEIDSYLIRNRRLRSRGKILKKWDEDGQTDKVIRFIQKLRKQDPQLPSELFLSVLFQCNNASEELYREGALPFKLDKQGRSPYLHALDTGNHKLIKLFAAEKDSKSEIVEALNQAIQEESLSNLKNLAELIDCWGIPEEGIDDQIEQAFKAGKHKITRLLLAFGLDPNKEVNGKSLSSLRSELDDTVMALVQAGADLKETQEGLIKELKEVREKAEAEFRELQIRLGKVEEIVDVDLNDKIRAFLDDPVYGAYYKAFYNGFSSKMNNEILSMQASLGSWTAASKTLTTQALGLVPKLVKSLFPMPGASLVASLAIKIPQHFIEQAKKDHLKDISSALSDPQYATHFVRIVTYRLLTLFKEQLTYFDKPTGDRGHQLNKSAIETFTSNLVTRLFAFMFYNDYFFREDLFWGDENKVKEIYRRANSLALSVTWFNPNKMYLLHYQKQNPFFNKTIIRLPTTRDSSHYQKFKQGARATGGFIVGAFKRKLDITGFKHALKTLTAEGLLQRSPIYIKEDHSYVQLKEGRPKHYPRLEITEYDKAYISAITKDPLQAPEPFELKTHSWRWFYGDLSVQQHNQPIIDGNSPQTQGKGLNQSGLVFNPDEVRRIIREESSKIIGQLLLNKLDRKTTDLENKSSEKINSYLSQLNDLSLLEVDKRMVDGLRNRLLGADQANAFEFYQTKVAELKSLDHPEDSKLKRLIVEIKNSFLEDGKKNALIEELNKLSSNAVGSSRTN